MPKIGPLPIWGWVAVVGVSVVAVWRIGRARDLPEPIEDPLVGTPLARPEATTQRAIPLGTQVSPAQGLYLPPSSPTIPTLGIPAARYTPGTNLYFPDFEPPAADPYLSTVSVNFGGQPMDIPATSAASAAGKKPANAAATTIAVNTAGRPQDKITKPGARGYITRRTDAMLRWASKKSGQPIRVTKGGYLPADPASGTTHTREAVDIADPPNRADRIALMHALKDAGFAVWWRPPGWDGSADNSHIHAIPRGGDISTSAAGQVRNFDAGTSGLTGQKDDDTYRPAPRRIFNYGAGKPQSI